MTIPLILLSGNSYDQGLLHGQLLQQEIAHNRNLYFFRFEHECRLPKHEVLARTALYSAEIERRHPDYFAGMRGIADGSNSPLEEIVALNVRYEILYYQYAVKGIADGCTSIVVDRQRSAENHLILAQNWDWFPDALGAILQTTYADGHQTLAYSEAGIFGGKFGLNSAGLGLLINGLISLNDNWQTLNTPFHIRCHQILQQRSLDSAIRVITRERRACSANFVIASAEDGAVNIEAAPEEIAIAGCDDGFIVHTNHFIDPDALGVSEPAEERIHTEHRYQRACQLMTTVGTVTAETIKAWLSDHDGYPNSICQHADPAVNSAEQYATVVSTLIDLDNGTMQVADGQPCQSEFTTLTLTSGIYEDLQEPTTK